MLFEENIPVVSRLRQFIHNTTEVIPGVFQVTHRGANILVIAEQKITLVDTGLRESASLIMDFIRHIGRSPEEVELVILTHNHIDHMGGMAEIKKNTGARVAIHNADIGERTHPPAADSRYREPLSILKSKLQSVFSVLSDDVDIVLEGSEVLNCLGGLEVIHTPGHTPGSISLYSRHHRMMITGDLIRKRRNTLMLPPRMVSSNLAENRESVRKLTGYEFDILCFGHGLPLYREAMSRVDDLLERGED